MTAQQRRKRRMIRRFAPTVALCAVIAPWAARIFARRLGGYTGDCLGAAQQVAELAIYCGILAAWNSI